MKRYPIPSEETRELLEEAKKRVEILLRKNFAIPPDMNVENCQGIHIVPGHRIGFTQKQAYLERLGDLYTEGYLTQEEYDHRVEWVNAAQTIEQADIVFTDVKNVPLGVPKRLYRENNRRVNRREHAKMIFFVMSVLLGMLLVTSPHLIWFGVGVLVVGFSYAFYQAHKQSK